MAMTTNTTAIHDLWMGRPDAVLTLFEWLDRTVIVLTSDDQSDDNRNRNDDPVTARTLTSSSSSLPARRCVDWLWPLHGCDSCCDDSEFDERSMDHRHSQQQQQQQQQAQRQPQNLDDGIKDEGRRHHRTCFSRTRSSLSSSSRHVDHTRDDTHDDHDHDDPSQQQESFRDGGDGVNNGRTNPSIPMILDRQLSPIVATLLSSTSSSEWRPWWWTLSNIMIVPITDDNSMIREPSIQVRLPVRHDESLSSLVDHVIWTLLQRKQRALMIKKTRMMNFLDRGGNGSRRNDTLPYQRQQQQQQQYAVGGSNILCQGYRLGIVDYRPFANGNSNTNGNSNNSSFYRRHHHNHHLRYECFDLNNTVDYCKTAPLMQFWHRWLGDDLLRTLLVDYNIFVPVMGSGSFSTISTTTSKTTSSSTRRSMIMSTNAQQQQHQYHDGNYMQIAGLPVYSLASRHRILAKMSSASISLTGRRRRSTRRQEAVMNQTLHCYHHHQLAGSTTATDMTLSQQKQRRDTNASRGRAVCSTMSTPHQGLHQDQSPPSSYQEKSGTGTPVIVTVDESSNDNNNNKNQFTNEMSTLYPKRDTMPTPVAVPAQQSLLGANTSPMSILGYKRTRLTNDESGMNIGDNQIRRNPLNVYAPNSRKKTKYALPSQYHFYHQHHHDGNDPLIDTIATAAATAAAAAGDSQDNGTKDQQIDGGLTVAPSSLASEFKDNGKQGGRRVTATSGVNAPIADRDGGVATTTAVCAATATAAGMIPQQQHEATTTQTATTTTVIERGGRRRRKRRQPTQPCHAYVPHPPEIDQRRKRTHNHEDYNEHHDQNYNTNDDLLAPNSLLPLLTRRWLHAPPDFVPHVGLPRKHVLEQQQQPTDKEHDHILVQAMLREAESMIGTELSSSDTGPIPATGLSSSNGKAATAGLRRLFTNGTTSTSNRGDRVAPLRQPPTTTTATATNTKSNTNTIITVSMLAVARDVIHGHHNRCDYHRKLQRYCPLPPWPQQQQKRQKQYVSAMSQSKTLNNATVAHDQVMANQHPPMEKEHRDSARSMPSDVPLQSGRRRDEVSSVIPPTCTLSDVAGAHVPSHAVVSFIQSCVKAVFGGPDPSKSRLNVDGGGGGGGYKDTKSVSQERAYFPEASLASCCFFGSMTNQNQVMNELIPRWISLRRGERLSNKTVTHGIHITHMEWLYPQLPPLSSERDRNRRPHQQIAEEDLTARKATSLFPSEHPKPPRSRYRRRRRPKLSLRQYSQLQRRVLSVLRWLLIEYVQPLLRATFYLTEGSNGFALKRLLFYRKPVWARFCRMSLQKLTPLGAPPSAAADASSTTLQLPGVEEKDKKDDCATADVLVRPHQYQVLPDQQSVMERLRHQHMGLSRLRLVPKKTGVRPIATLGKREHVHVASDVATQIQSDHQKSGETKAMTLSGGAICDNLDIDSSQDGGSENGRSKKKAKASSAECNSTLPRQRNSKSLSDQPRARQLIIGGKQSPYLSTNKILRDVFAVLQFERDRNADAYGAGLEGLPFFYPKYRDFLEQFRAHQQSTSSYRSSMLYFASVDIQRCYDAINQDELLTIVDKLLSESHYFVQRYKIVHAKKTMARRVCPSREIAKVGPPEDFDPFHRTVQAASHQYKRCVFVDENSCSSISKDQIMDLLRELLTSHLVVMPGRRVERYLLQSTGIPQGCVLSSLLCNIYYGHVERQLSIGAPRGGGPQLLARMIDDFLFVTTDLASVKQFLQTMYRGDAARGVEINKGKTLASLQVSIQDGDSMTLFDTPSLDECPRGFIPWCGMLFDVESGEVRVDYSRFFDGKGLDGMNVYDGKSEGCILVPQMTTFVTARCLPILYDPRVNGSATRATNFYELSVLAAIKTVAYLRTSTLKVDTNLPFLVDSIRAVISFARNTIANRLNDKKVIFLTYRVAMWLGWQAFHDVLTHAGTDMIGLLCHLEPKLIKPTDSGYHSLMGRCRSALLGMQLDRLMFSNHVLSRKQANGRKCKMTGKLTISHSRM